MASSPSSRARAEAALRRRRRAPPGRRRSERRAVEHVRHERRPCRGRRRTRRRGRLGLPRRSSLEVALVVARGAVAAGGRSTSMRSISVGDRLRHVGREADAARGLPPGEPGDRDRGEDAEPRARSGATARSARRPGQGGDGQRSRAAQVVPQRRAPGAGVVATRARRCRPPSARSAPPSGEADRRRRGALGLELPVEVPESDAAGRRRPSARTLATGVRARPRTSAGCGSVRTRLARGAGPRRGRRVAAPEESRKRPSGVNARPVTSAGVAGETPLARGGSAGPRRGPSRPRTPVATWRPAGCSGDRRHVAPRGPRGRRAPSPTPRPTAAPSPSQPPLATTRPSGEKRTHGHRGAVALEDAAGAPGAAGPTGGPCRPRCRSPRARRPRVASTDATVSPWPSSTATGGSAARSHSAHGVVAPGRDGRGRFPRTRRR